MTPAHTGAPRECPKCLREQAQGTEGPLASARSHREPRFHKASSTMFPPMNPLFVGADVRRLKFVPERGRHDIRAFLRQLLLGSGVAMRETGLRGNLSHVRYFCKCARVIQTASLFPNDQAYLSESSHGGEGPSLPPEFLQPPGLPGGSVIISCRKRLLTSPVNRSASSDDGKRCQKANSSALPN